MLVALLINFWLLNSLTGAVKAETISKTVCASGIAGQNGCDYISADGIQTAIAQAEVGTRLYKTSITIRSGSYFPGSCIDTLGKNLVISGENSPVINGSGNPIFGICVGNGEVEINNLVITNYNGVGISVEGNARVTISNNLIINNNLDGILFSGHAVGSVVNNTLFHNRVSGISLYNSDYDNPAVSVTNNIIADTLKNTDATFGFGIAEVNYFSQPVNMTNDYFGYNLVWANAGANTGCDTHEVCNFVGKINADPKFNNSAAGNFHLFATSTAIDKGDPTQSDPDGSRSDIGAYGGMGMCGLDMKTLGCAKVSQIGIMTIRQSVNEFKSILDYNQNLTNFGRTAVLFDRNVMVLNFNPVVSGRKLNELMGWHNPSILVNSYINDVFEASHQMVKYKIVENQEINDYPVKADGFKYTEQTYLNCWQTKNCHSPDLVDYGEILATHNVCEKLNSGIIDELWLFGAPYFGFWESVMAGQGAFNTNAPPITNSTCQKKLHIMGFNYERSVALMLEDLGHRTEGVMREAYGGWDQMGTTAWDKFTWIDINHPGMAGCGDVHFAPNSESDYDWNNSRSVNSTCEDWLNYPYLTGAGQIYNCTFLGCQDYEGYEYKKWWLFHLPHTEGVTDGKLNNWWKYVLWM